MSPPPNDVTLPTALPQQDSPVLNGVNKGPPVEGESSSDAERRARAASIIQRQYREYRVRRHQRQSVMELDARWDDLVKRTSEMGVVNDQLDNKNDVQSRWHRGVKAAVRLQKGDGLYEAAGHELSEADASTPLSPETIRRRKATFWGRIGMGAGKMRDETEELPFESKHLEQQHWLEMIDGKHRYGSNLKYYFRQWKEADTQDNFFRWLDRGDGKDLDLEELPRERLEQERITYLSAEQRLNYLVKVDKDGLLRWVRNSELVDTAAGKWKDSGDGEGIVPDEGFDGTASESALYRPGRQNSSGSDESDRSDSYSQLSEMDENEDTHYVGLDKHEEKNWLQRKAKDITPNGIRQQILRRTVKRNTWIYVSDMKMNMFVGIKNSGDFQHSSFLAGGKVTSAGIIVVKRGLIKSLNPWSGHYRSSIQHYRAFIAQLEAKGADLSHVKVGKSIMSLWGLTKYAKITKNQKSLGQQVQAHLGLTHEPTEEEQSEALMQRAEKERQAHEGRVTDAEEEQKEERAAHVAGGDDRSNEAGEQRERREILNGGNG